MESVTLTVKNDPRPEKGLGVEFNDMNAVVAIMKGGVAAKEGKLKVGDVVTSVDGISVKGKKVLSVMSESATSFSLVVSRYTSAEQQALHAGDAPADVVDIEGWLFKVKARDGRAIRLPKKRWVVLQGSTLTWFEDAKGEAEANSQALLGAVCTIPMKSSNYAMTPAMKASPSSTSSRSCSTGPTAR